ncbi:DUF637 domain-containing protein, partial [Ralstonia nicotianae]
PATAVLGGVGPQTLINALPADLRPGSTPFYYDPQAENQRLDQAALAQTGRTSFINGLTYDSQTHLTVDDQQKLILYQNAVDYAKAHSVQLGQALTPGQLAALDKPMLWYVTQQVPDPNCLSGACPMVSALVPQVYLPQGYSGIESGGSIVASKSLELLADSPIRNTGTLGSYGTLTSNTTIINEQRAAEMTAAWQPIEDGWARTTGQQGQANSGFVFAANAAGIAGQIQNINGVVAQLNADGTMSAAEAARVAAAVQAGMQAVTSTHTDTFVRSESWFGQLFAGVVMVAIGIMTGGAAMAAYAGVGATLTVGQAMAQAAISSMTTNAMQQTSSGMGFSFGALVKAGATSALTAGLTQGITIGADGTLGTADSLSSVASDRSIAALSGTKAVGDGLTQASAATGTLGQQLAALALDASIKAGVNTAINGGSFLTNLRDSAVNDLAAIAAYGIGNLNANGTLVGPAYYAAHALLGCASSAALGTGCGGGAIGGVTSALLAPDIIKAIDPTGAPLDAGQQAVLAAFAGLAGGGMAGALGQNVQGGMAAAQNEALNNSGNHAEDAAKKGGLLNQSWDAVVDWAKWTYSNPIGDTERGLRNFLSVGQRNGRDAQTDPNRQLDPNGGGSNTGSPSAPAVVVAFGAILCLLSGGTACGMMMVPVPAPSGSPPGNAILSSSSSGSDSGGSASGQGSSSAASGSPSTLANNRLTGKVAEVEVGTSLKGQGLDVQPQVSMTSDSTRAVADFAVNGRPNATVQVPQGYVAEDISGKPLLGANGAPIKSFNLNAQGQAIVEVKTGGAALTSNQSNVYPAVQSGAAKPVGGNATNAFGAPLPENLEKTPVVVLRKK